MRYSDIELARQLERTEALANADFVTTRAAIEPASGAKWIQVGGAFAMFDGVESPLTQTFGLGMFEEATTEHLDAIEAFYKERNAPVFHEVSPLATPSLLALLGDRGYRPIELTNVMYHELDAARPKLTQLNPNIAARVICPDEADLWAETASKGWATEHPMLGDFMLAFGKIAARTTGGHPFLAKLEGKTIAAGGFAIYDDVCILSGATTIPEARRQGAQNALLSARLDHAAAHGCSLAMMCALPGSQSQKNAEKNGFKIAYTRIKWQLFK